MESESWRNGPSATPRVVRCSCSGGLVTTSRSVPLSARRPTQCSRSLRPNTLLLSTAASANHPALLPLYDWFSRNLLLAEAGSRPWRQALTTEMLGDPSNREQVLALLQAADLGVVDAKKHEPDPVMRERLRRAVRILSGIEDEPDGEDGPTFEELGIRLTHRGADGDVELDADDRIAGNANLVRCHRARRGCA